MVKKILVVFIIAASLILITGTLPLRAEGESAGDTSPLQIVPETLDLGTLTPGGYLRGIFYMKSTVSADMTWRTAGPSGWVSAGGKKLSSRMKNSLGYMEVGLKFLDRSDQGENNDSQRVQMILESEGETVYLEKTLPFGAYEEKIDILGHGGQKTVVLKFETALQEAGPEMEVDPPGIDFGTVEGTRTVTGKLKIRNVGKGTLVWKAGLLGGRQVVDGRRIKKGMYVSFLNEDIRESDEYLVPARFADALQLTGTWFSEEGYPSSFGEDTLRYAFTGSGIALILHSDEDGRKLKARIDDGPAVTIDTFSEEPKRSVIDVAENLAEGPHVLTLVNQDGYAEIEGARIYGNDVSAGVPGWITVFPAGGTSMSQTNYVTVTANTEHLTAGNYSEPILIHSNSGAAVVDVSLRVTRDRTPSIIDVYRYVRNGDYLYTGHPETENFSVLRHYRKERLAFRLFREDTPGTKKFYRWYNQAKGDHYYSYDPGGGGQSLAGYVLEGSIGNIGTSRILGARELYRWYNASTGRHFYTTDIKGEGMARKGYRFEGIAGYVR